MMPSSGLHVAGMVHAAEYSNACNACEHVHMHAHRHSYTHGRENEQALRLTEKVANLGLSNSEPPVLLKSMVT